MDLADIMDSVLRGLTGEYCRGEQEPDDAAMRRDIEEKLNALGVSLDGRNAELNRVQTEWLEPLIGACERKLILYAGKLGSFVPDPVTGEEGPCWDRIPLEEIGDEQKAELLELTLQMIRLTYFCRLARACRDVFAAHRRFLL